MKIRVPTARPLAGRRVDRPKSASSELARANRTCHNLTQQPPETPYDQTLPRPLRRPDRPRQRRPRRHPRQRPPLPQLPPLRGLLHHPPHRPGDGRPRLPRAVDRRAPLPARRLRVPAQPDPARPLARHPDQAPQVRLRVQRAADVASDPARRGLRDGRHRHRRPRHHGRRPRLPHARGGDLRRPADRRRQEPRILRGAASAHARLLQPGERRVQGQVLHLPARGGISRLPAPRHHHGAAAEAPAGGGLDAGRLRQDHRHDGEVRPQGDGHAERREDPRRCGARLSGRRARGTGSRSSWART